MKISRVASAVALAVLAHGLVPSASAQIELNVHAGAMFVQEADVDELVLSPFNDGGTELLVGARAVINPDGGPGFALSGDRMSLEGATVWLYSAALEYTLPSTLAPHLFGGVGLGGVTTDFDDDLDLFDGGALGAAQAGDELDTETDLLVPIFFGVKGFNREEDPSWAFRLEVRDNLVFSEEVDGSTETFNNWEVSAGLSWIIGN